MNIRKLASIRNAKDTPPRWRSRLWLVWMVVITIWVAALSTIAIGDMSNQQQNNILATLMLIGMVIAFVAWLAGRRRQHNRYSEQLAKWSADRAIITERIAIARELHDLVSNGLGAITMSAAAAQLSAGPNERSAAVLADIEATSRQATKELRRMLTVLRTSNALPLESAEQLNDLSRIVAEARVLGLDVDFDDEVLNDLSNIPASTQMVICAIVREGLANTLRHCGPTRAHVSLRRSPDNITVSVLDDGAAPNWRPAPGTGQGLVGLRERADMLGGHLTAGRNSASGGWLLQVVIPEGTN